MSTKCYEGKKLNTANLSKIRDVLQQLKIEIEEESRKLIAEKACDLFFKAVDEKLTSKQIVESLWFDSDTEEKTAIERYVRDGGNSLFKLIMNLMEYKQQCVKKSSTRDPAFDYHVEIFIYPLNNKKTLFYPSYEQREFGRIIDKYFIEYGYWNNTDPLETVSSREWSQRRKDWDAVLNYEYDKMSWQNFCGHHYPFNLFNVKDCDYLVDYFEENQPSEEDRLKFLSKKIIRSAINLRKDEFTKNDSFDFLELRRVEKEVEEQKANEVKKFIEEGKGTLKKFNRDDIIKAKSQVEEKKK